MPHSKNTTPSVIDDQTGGATDQVGEGTRDIAGAEASELPDHGRGPAETNIGKEMARKLPQDTGGLVGGNVGIAGEPDVAKSHDHGKRGHN